MELGDLSDEERRIIEAQVRASGNGATLEHMLTEASQMLSGMSRGAGLVLAAKSEVALKHIEFIQLEPTKALAVLVSQNGDVENRIVELPAGITASQLHEASNFLNAHIRGRTLAEAQGRDRHAQGGDQGRARHAVAGAGREGAGRLGRRRERPAGAADRARPRQSARKRHGARPTSSCCGICSRIWRRRTG